MLPHLEYEQRLHALLHSYGFWVVNTALREDTEATIFGTPGTVKMATLINPKNGCYLWIEDSSERELDVGVNVDGVIVGRSLFGREAPGVVERTNPVWQGKGLSHHQIVKAHILNRRVEQYNGKNYTTHKDPFHRSLDFYLRRHAGILGIQL